MAWLGQFQWARRFGERDYQVIFKSNLQLANDPLLPMEKCALGGLETVRGYPENTLVRDECFVASLEFRVPVYQLPLAGISRGPNEDRCNWRRLRIMAMPKTRVSSIWSRIRSPAPAWECAGIRAPRFARRCTGAIHSRR